MNEIHLNDNIHILEKFILENQNFKMIYIDPPYNTGSKLSYKDRRSSSDWSEMMKSRLEKAKTILSQDGAIFISIDDNELYSLKMMCDEIFGKVNFLGNLITKQAQRSNAKHINVVHEYILVYAKSKDKLHPFKINRIYDPISAIIIRKLYKSIKFEGSIIQKEKKLKETSDKLMKEFGITWIRNYCNVDEIGRIFFAKDLSTPGVPRKVSIPDIELFLDPLISRGWSSDDKLIRLHKLGLLHFKGNRPYEIHFLEDAIDNISSILDFYSRQGTEDLKKIGLTNIFDTAKPVELIKYLIRIGTNKTNDRILDFFAGSGTTAQAVLEVNKEDGKDLEFVLVQIDEPVAENSKAYKKCIELEISPTVSNLMLYRVDKFIEISNIQTDYKIFDYDGEGKKYE